MLQESEAKLEMKFLTPLQFLCGGRLPWGINKNNHIWIGRCIVTVVTAIDDVGLRDHVLTKKFHPQKVKVNESGSRLHLNHLK